MNDSSNPLMNVKKTRSLDNIFIFKDPKKSLKKTPLGHFLHNERFYELEKNQKQTQTFDTKFRERDQSVAINAHIIFPFYGSTKK